MISKTLIQTSLLLILSMFSLAKAFAQVEEISVELKGLKCEFCVKKAESGLKEINWIQSAHVDLDASVAHIMVKRGKYIDLGELNQKVKDSGFAPDKIEITATGKLTQYDGFTALKVTDSDQMFILIDQGLVEEVHLIQTGKRMKVRND